MSKEYSILPEKQEEDVATMLAIGFGISLPRTSPTPLGWALALALGLAASARAEFPVANMDARSLGLQYGFAMHGQEIRQAQASSQEVFHLVSLAYAPIPYLSVEAGLGFERFAVEDGDRLSFRGEYGPTPAFGLALFSPAMADILRVTAGDKSCLLNSRDGKGHRYSGLVSNPFFGLIFSPTGQVDLALGARMNRMDGSRRVASEPTGGDLSFANQNIPRGYLSVTLKPPAERAFMTFDLDLSPRMDADWSEGPREASFGISFGTVLGGKSRSAIALDSSRYFPAYPEMKSKQDKMAGEIE